MIKNENIKSKKKDKKKREKKKSVLAFEGLRL